MPATSSLYCSRLRKAFAADVAAVVHAVEVNAGAPQRTRCRWRRPDPRPQAVTPSTRPPAVSSPAGAEACAGVEDGGSSDSAASIPAIGFPVSNAPGIAAGRQHHADGRAGPPFAARALGNAPRAAASSSGAKSLRMRCISGWVSGIAQAHVELQHLGPVAGHHQAGVEKAGEAGGLDGRMDDAVENRAASRASVRIARRSMRPCRRCSGPGRHRRPPCGPAWASSGTTLRPSHSTMKLTSSPRRNSSITRRPVQTCRAPLRPRRDPGR